MMGLNDNNLRLLVTSLDVYGKYRTGKVIGWEALFLLKEKMNVVRNV